MEDQYNRIGSAIRRTSGYGLTPIYGAGGGGAFGALLAGRKGAIAGAALGAVGATAWRAKLGERISRAEHAGQEVKADALNAVPGFSALGVGAASAIGYSPALRAAGTARRSADKFYDRARGAVRSAAGRIPKSGKLEVVSHIPEGAKYAMKQLRYSARDELDSIIELGMKRIQKRKGLKIGNPFHAIANIGDMGPQTLSAREQLGEIIQFKGGYTQVEDGPGVVFKQPGLLSHLKRNAWTYGGLAASIPLGPIGGLVPILGGGFADTQRAKSNIVKTLNEPPVKRDGKKLRLSHRLLADDSGNAALIPMSAREELNLILFADPRPRNRLGEFNGGDEEGANPAAIDQAYKEPQRQMGVAGQLAVGAGGSAAGTGALKGVQALLAKLKGRV